MLHVPYFSLHVPYLLLMFHICCYLFIVGKWSGSGRDHLLVGSGRDHLPTTCRPLADLKGPDRVLSWSSVWRQVVAKWSRPLPASGREVVATTSRPLATTKWSVRYFLLHVPYSLLSGGSKNVKKQLMLLMFNYLFTSFVFSPSQRLLP